MPWEQPGITDLSSKYGWMTTRTFALNTLPGNGGTIPFLSLAIGCGGK